MSELLETIEGQIRGKYITDLGLIAKQANAEIKRLESENERLQACIIDMENDTSCLPEDMTVSDTVRLFRKEIKRLTEALVTIAECKDARAMYNVARAAVQDAPRDGE